MAEHRISLKGMWDDLERVGIDPMTSMNKHLPTSLFKDDGIEWGRWKYPEYLVPPPPLPDPMALASDIISMVTSDVAGFAASYLGEKIGDLLSPPTVGDIIGLAGQHIPAYIIGPREVYEEILCTQESTHDDRELETLVTNINEIKTKVETQVSNVEEKVFGLVDQAAEWIDPIKTYIYQGPDWVEAEANNIDSRAVKEIAHQIDIRFEKLRAEKRQFINNLAEKWAKKQAMIINETIYEKAWEPIKLAEAAVQRAKNVAIGVAKDAICYMKALMGL